MQYCYVLSLTGSLGMGISCMSFISSLSCACIALEKYRHLIPVFSSRCQTCSAHGWRTEASQDKMYVVGRQSERREIQGKRVLPWSTLLCLMSLQQFGKVLSFTSFYCFCCLPSLYFFLNGFKRKKDIFFLLYWGYIFWL